MLYRLRSDVTFTDISDRYQPVALQGEGVFTATHLTAEEGKATAFLHGIAYTDPRTKTLGVRALLPRETAESTLTEVGFVRDDSAYDRLRIRACIPEGEKDLVPEKAFPLEYGMETLHAIDFKKGCYVGQEVTARTTYRGTVRKHIYRIRSTAPLPEHGTDVLAGDTKIGIICSHSGMEGLALLRSEHLEAAQAEALSLEAGGIPIHIVTTEDF
jgi:folate-binding protein YgfZ